jgi:hypothetical protein
MTELKRAIAKGAKEGRYGDSDLVHVNDREKLILALLGGAATRNPKTGRLEYYDGSSYDSDSGRADGSNSGCGPVGGGDPMGNAADYGMAGPVGPADPMGTGFDYTPSAGWSAPDMTGMGRGENEARLSGYGWAGRKIGAMMDNPIATVANLGFNALTGGIPAALNTVSGLANGPTFGGMATAAGRGLAGMANPEGAQVAGQVEGKTTGAMSASGDPGGLASPDGGDPSAYNPTQSGPSGSGMSPLAAALLGQTENQFGGRKTFGAPVMSSSPFGRQYTTPWAYRG